MRLVAFGELLWDVFQTGEKLGGAPFNLASHARCFSHDVCFISGVGLDRRGALALTVARKLRVSTDYIVRTAAAPTGTVDVTLTNGQPSYVIRRPAAYDFLSAPAEDLGADWICFGTLVATNEHARAELKKLLAANPSARRFYDVNLRRDSWTPGLVSELIALADVVKLNDDEAALIDVSSCRNVCLTRGAHGCTIRYEGEEVSVPGIPVRVVDAVGAGDAWGAAFLHGINSGWPLRRVAEVANRLGALVATREGAIPEWRTDEILP